MSEWDIFDLPLRHILDIVSPFSICIPPICIVDRQLLYDLWRYLLFPLFNSICFVLFFPLMINGWSIIAVIRYSLRCARINHKVHKNPSCFGDERKVASGIAIVVFYFTSKT